MDGQGTINNQTIKIVLSLTNVVIINFNFKELNQIDSVLPIDKVFISKRFQVKTTQYFTILSF